MMSSIITGLFSSQGQSAQIAADLENVGFLLFRLCDVPARKTNQKRD